MRPEITMASHAFHNMMNGANSNRDKDYDTDPASGAHSSGFTAVNGRTSRSPPHSAKDQSHTARAATHAPDQKPPPPARQPEPWSYQNQPQRHESQPVHPPLTRRDSTGSHKRKRSGSQEVEGSRPAAFSANGPRRRTEGFPSPENEQYSENSDEGYPESATTSPQAKPHPPNGANGESSPWPSRTDGPNAGPSNAHARPYHGDSERQHSPGYQNADQSGSSAAHDPDGNAHETARAEVQGDPKKRKRQFANRTKTGCQTCRRRKKKCDEHKPECNNCTRGGFVCEGYTTKTTWQHKSDNSRGPVNIVSKEEGAPTAMYGRFPSHPPREFHESQPSHQQHPDGARPRPIVVDELDRRASRGHWPAPWPSNSNEPPPPQRQYPPPPQHEYGPPSSHGPPRGYHEQQQPPPPHRHPSSSAYPPAAGPSPNHPTHSSHSNHAATAQLALQHSSHGSHQGPIPAPPMSAKPYHQQQGPPPGPPPEPPTEKQKMLKGERHLIMDPELVRERDACKEVLWRYNNAMSPVTKASREARDSLFREIVHAAWVPRVNSQSTPVGSAGRNITVEAPFTCDYGYNIHLGDNVLIGQNCTILDSVKVSIGANTIIGPNVSIYAGTASSDGHLRVTEKGLCGYGKEVRIEEDCFIGGNVIIMAGCTIGKGSTVGAGSVVRENVPTHTVNTGNPTKVTRGIYSGR